MKKILFVITKANWGGAQKYVFDLAYNLKNDFDVTVAYGTEGMLAHKLTEANIKTIRIDSLGRDVNPLLDIKSFFSLISLYRNLKPDVVHLNSSKIGGLGSLAGRLTGIKNIIFTAHGWAFNEERSWIAKKIIWKLSWLTALFSHTIINLGKREYDQTVAMPFISKKKATIIPIGIAVPDFLERIQARHHIAKHLGIATDEHIPWIVTVAELHPNKGLTYALEACKTLTATSYRYIIIGSGELYESLKGKISELQLIHVHLFGHLDQSARYLKAFDGFILPSLKEGLPYVLLEAGAASLPVVATTVGNIPELIENEKNGILIAPKDTHSLNLALHILLDDKDFARTIGENLQKTVTERYTLNSMVSHTRDVYNR